MLKDVNDLVRQGVALSSDMADDIDPDNVTSIVDAKQRKKGGRPAKADWEKDLIAKPRGGFQPWLSNVVSILTHYKDWDGVIAYDEFNNAVVSLKKPPWFNDDAGRGSDVFQRGTPWSEEDYARAGAWFERSAWEISAGDSVIYKAVRLVAEKNCFHPVRDWLDSLAPCDDPGILDQWLTRFLGVPADDYSRLVGRWTLISAVARVMSPGSKVQTVMILEGLQGKGKSTAIETLVHNRNWVLDTPLDMANKEGWQAVQGKWIVELAELEGMNRQEVATAKSFLARSKDSFREPFARKPRDFDRQCIFIGSVNLDEYLKDDTGNRRYLPVRCEGNIDIKGLAENRELLWAAALAAYRDNKPWHPATKEEVAMCSEEQDERYVAHPWEDKIAEWIEKKGSITTTTIVVGGVERVEFDSVRMGRILSEALDLATRAQTRTESTAVGRIMKRLGWVKKRPRDGGKLTRVYVRASDWDAAKSAFLAKHGQMPLEQDDASDPT